MADKTQRPLDFGNEDLPLFSGIPIRIKPLPGPASPNAGTQQGSYSFCRTCMDTGRIGAKFCWCQAGIDARQGKVKRTLTRHDVRKALTFPDHAGVCVQVCTRREHFSSPYGWTESLELGRSYMVGVHRSMKDYMRMYKKPMVPWQQRAYQWALENPTSILTVTEDGYEWEIEAQAEYVIFALPFQGAGGERHYISRDGERMYCVNLD